MNQKQKPQTDLQTGQAVPLLCLGKSLKRLVAHASTCEPVSARVFPDNREKNRVLRDFRGFHAICEPEKSAFSGHNSHFSLCHITAYLFAETAN
jgi:hypothetical protein